MTLRGGFGRCDSPAPRASQVRVADQKEPKEERGDGHEVHGQHFDLRDRNVDAIAVLAQAPGGCRHLGFQSCPAVDVEAVDGHEDQACDEPGGDAIKGIDAVGEEAVPVAVVAPLAEAERLAAKVQAGESGHLDEGQFLEEVGQEVHEWVLSTARLGRVMNHNVRAVSGRLRTSADRTCGRTVWRQVPSA